MGHLVELGLAAGMRVRFRRDPADRWLLAVVEQVERDGSLGLRDHKGASRAIPVELVEVETRGPRGAKAWEPVLERAARNEQLKMFQVDKQTVAAYEGDDAAERFLQRRRAYRPERAEAFAAQVEGLRLDVGAGVGHYTALLGVPIVSLDASHAMLRRVPTHSPRVQADLAALPFRRGAFNGAWAARSYQHIPHEALPLALADLHRSLAVDSPVLMHVFAGEGSHRKPNDDSFPNRLFAMWDPVRLRAIVEGAGFLVDGVDIDEDNVVVTAARARMLPDFVRPGLRVLFCGYNPSPYAADHGIPFGRPGNRFWPAVLASGLLSVDRDPWHAVHHHDVGFTDMVKRTTVAATELAKDELRAGFERVTSLCEWLQPAVLCVLGVGGWRDLVDKKARVGWQPETLGSTRVYVMPNPSGLNASTQHEGFVEHLRTVYETKFITRSGGE